MMMTKRRPTRTKIESLTKRGRAPARGQGPSFKQAVETARLRREERILRDLDRIRDLAERALPYVERWAGVGPGAAPHRELDAETLAVSVRVALQETGGVVCQCGTPLDIRSVLGWWPICPKCNPGLAEARRKEGEAARR